MPTYPDFDDKYEYLDLSHRSMPVDDLKDILYDLIDDTMILHINLSYVVPEDITANPVEMEPLMRMLLKSLRENAVLIALDWAGNHLGDYAPHPTNQHTMDYIVELADALAKSSVKRIDLSDNMMTGPGRRKLSGVARVVRHCIPSKWQVLRFRDNGLNGLAVGLFGEALGLKSKLVELDLSDNQAGRDPHNRPSCDGIKVLCVNLAETHTLRKLKLARNMLADEEIVELSKALMRLPNLMVLDLAGNDFRDVGMRALREAISSHASFFKPREGLKDLNISHNRLGERGLAHLMAAVRSNDSLTSLDVSRCRLNVPGVEALAEALKDNSKIRNFSIADNNLTDEQYRTITAETTANGLLVLLRTKPHAVDTGTLSDPVYYALARKLRFLTQPVLAMLHENESFTEPLAPMTEALYLLEPPSRTEILGNVLNKSNKFDSRLRESTQHAERMGAALRIFSAAMVWYRRLRMRKMAMTALGKRK